MPAFDKVEKLRIKAAQARRLAAKMPQADTVALLLRIADQFETEAGELCYEDTAQPRQIRR